MKNKWFLSLFSLILMLLLGCNENVVFEKSTSINNSWNRYDTAIFFVEVDDTINPHNFFINIRNNNLYEYSNLYVFLHTSLPNGITTHDTLEFILADKQGKWLGKGVGKIMENDILLRNRLVFPETGNYVFKIEQGMRDEDLVGIENIGIRIEKDTEN